MGKLVLDFPDVDELLTTALASALPGVNVGIQRPAKTVGDDGVPRQVVVVRRDGGPSEGIALLISTVSFLCWAADDGAATDLASAVQKAVTSLALDPTGLVTAVDVAQSQVPVADDSDIPCRLLGLQLYVRGY